MTRATVAPDQCSCGHDLPSHRDERDEWTACAQCGCIGYHPPPSQSAEGGAS